MFTKDLFSGKVAIVSGGGTGIGKEIARTLIGLGCKVMITGRREEKLKHASAEFLKPELCTYVQADIRNEEDVQKIFNETKEKFGQIDFLVNNAGGQFIAPFEKISTNALDAVVKTNLYGTWFMCQEAVKHMKETGGRIINIVHIYAVRAGPGISHSGAARAGVINLSKSLALEYAEHNITVNAIAPGITKTKGFEEEMINNKKMMQMLSETIPMHRFAEPQEVADVIAFLCSPGGAYITGECICIDGGQVLGNWPDFTKLGVRE